MIQSPGESQPSASFRDREPKLFDDLVTAFDGYWQTLPESIRARRTDDERQNAFQADVAFVDRVLGGVQRFAEEHPSGQLTILFDVDHTIALPGYNNAWEKVQYVRAGCGVLARALEVSLGDRYDVGTLTARGQDHLAAELQEPTWLKAVGTRVNPDFVCSSHRSNPIFQTSDTLREVPMEGELGSVEAVLAAISKVLKQRLIPDIRAAAGREDETYEGVITGGRWGIAKLAVLQHLVEVYPDRLFVYVDDLVLPEYVEHPRVCAISLLPDAVYRI